MAEGMKKFKIELGIYDDKVLYSNIIKAHNPEEAVDKFLEGNGDFNNGVKEKLVQKTVEYVSKPREKKPVKLIDIMMMMIAHVENGLAYNEIGWSYVPDKLEMAMGMGHPADILDDMFCNLGNRLWLDENAKVTKKELKELLKNLKAFYKGFSVKELKKPIDALDEFIKNM